MAEKAVAKKEGGGEEKNQHLYKVLVVGDFSVGKTSLIRRTVQGVFTGNYKITIGVDFFLKKMDWSNNTTINLQLWDIAGHERFGNFTRAYYKYAIAALVVFDLSRPSTLERAKEWKNSINENVCLQDNQPIPMLLLANKCDLEDVSIDEQALDKFCAENGFLKWFKTSAKENINIEESLKYLVERILKISKSNMIQPPESIISFEEREGGSEEEPEAHTEQKKSKCC